MEVEVEIELRDLDDSIDLLKDEMEEPREETKTLNQNQAEMLKAMESYKEALFLMANGQVERVGMHKGALKLKLKVVA